MLKRNRRSSQPEYVKRDYSSIDKVPSNIIFARVTANYMPLADPEMVEIDRRFYFQRHLKEDGTLSKDVVVVAANDPNWKYLKVGMVVDRQTAYLDCGAFGCGAKVISVRPMTEARRNQIAYLFTKAILEKEGITLSWSTHRQIGQWANAIGVQIDELKAAIHPFVTVIRTDLLKTILDHPVSSASPASVTFLALF